MTGFDLEWIPTWLLVVIFVVAAVGVWWSGTRLTVAADRIAERRGLGRVFVGALILGVTTSLPEVATTVTAVMVDDVQLAGSNLLGGVPIQIVVLAAADGLVLHDRALTYFVPHPVLIVQGVMLVLILALACGIIAVGGGFSIGRLDIASLLLVGAYLLSLYVVFGSEGAKPRWLPAGDVADAIEETLGAAPPSASEPGPQVGPLLASAVGVLVFGSLIAITADTFAAQTGVASGVLGATAVAFATSLPEVSTTFAAVRQGAYAMAIGNILGTNTLEVALLGVADVAEGGGTFFAALGPSAVYLGALGIVVTCIYLWGMLERRDRTVLSMGQDSALVVAVYVAGMIGYAWLR